MIYKYTRIKFHFKGVPPNQGQKIFCYVDLTHFNDKDGVGRVKVSWKLFAGQGAKFFEKENDCDMIISVSLRIYPGNEGVSSVFSNGTV